MSIWPWEINIKPLMIKLYEALNRIKLATKSNSGNQSNHRNWYKVVGISSITYFQAILTFSHCTQSIKLTHLLAQKGRAKIGIQILIEKGYISNIDHLKNNGSKIIIPCTKVTKILSSVQSATIQFSLCT